MARTSKVAVMIVIMTKVWIRIRTRYMIETTTIVMKALNHRFGDEVFLTVGVHDKTTSEVIHI